MYSTNQYFIFDRNPNELSSYVEYIIDKDMEEFHIHNWTKNHYDYQKATFGVLTIDGIKG